MKRLWWFVIGLMAITLLGCRSVAGPPTPTPVLPTPTLTPEIGLAFVTRAAPTVAIVQTTPTPLPTATVTPTPTPIIHTVVAGETLLGIALAKGTTTEEIQALNPEINPRLLPIGQALILPPPAANVTQLPQAVAVAVAIEVAQLHAYQTPVETIWLLGEVINEGEVPAENIQVEIALVAADGQITETRTAWAVSSILMPGERAPFAVLLSDPPSFVSESVSVIGAQAVNDTGSRHVDVSVVQAAVSSSGETVQLEGELQNTGKVTAVEPTIVATFYDEAGQMTGFSQQTVADTLGPGETIPFTVETTLPGGEAADTAVSVFALQAAAAEN